MKLTDSVLKDIRKAVGLDGESEDFDTDLLMYINSAIGELRQNGATLSVTITDTETTWEDLRNPLATSNNEYFHMVPSYIAMSVKLVFDPPPPSAVEAYVKQKDGILWRLKIAYEDFTTNVTERR